MDPQRIRVWQLERFLRNNTSMTEWYMGARMSSSTLFMTDVEIDYALAMATADACAVL